VLALILAMAAPADAALTEGARLASVYDAILAADFERARVDLARACPPAPAEACSALRLASLWWRIVLDSNRRTLDQEFRRTANETIAAAAAWTRREPGRGEAWFYLAGSYAPLVQFRVLRGERLAAARDGARIKSALERALALDPTLEDAYFGIGLYHYYADVAPLGAKILRMLMLLPGGDRARGLREMLQARERGMLLRGEADFQLHWLYLWYEKQPERAREIVRGLDARYPSNPVFLTRLAAIEHEYFHDHRASAAAWQALADRAPGRVSGAPGVEARARLGLASELIELSEPQRAATEIDRAIAGDPTLADTPAVRSLRRKLLTR
jgi:tetratricopeptide (TPR) repeat protein